MTRNPRCANCKHLLGDHQFKTLECPTGVKTRIGWIHYGPTKFKSKYEKHKENQGEGVGGEAVQG